MKITDEPVVVEQTFSTSSGELWKAITELKEMRLWFFNNISSFKPKVGFKTAFVVENDGRIFSHRWEIIEVIPLKKISYKWRYEGYPGDSTVIFLLKESHKQTHLKVTHKVLEDFPPDIPEFTRESCKEGWVYFIQKSLKQYLTKTAKF